MPEIIGKLSAALADRYQIERELGQGGMATVYLAHDVKHNRPVAVKVLRPELVAILGAERFLKEIEVTANLQHPNVLPLYDSGEAGSFLFYVMPFIDGESLRERLDREKQLGVDETVQIAQAVAAALDYAHRQDVIHRDIKPENVLLYEGQALVADFGIALAVSQAGGSRITETGLSIGTPHYMSPEQAAADRELDGRTDIYSLGAMTYEMLVGRPPFEAASAQAVMSKIMTEPARPVSAERPSVPSNIDAAVGVALEKLPADRFSTPAQFAEALQNPAFETRTMKGVPRAQSAPVANLGWAVAAVATMVAAWGWLRPEPPQHVLRYNTMPPGEWAESGFYARVAVSPDGSRYAYVAAEEQDRNETMLGPASRALWLRQRDQLRATRIAGTEQAWNPFFSPDGSRVGFLDARSNSLKSVSLDGGPATTVADNVGLSGASWGPDGYIYANAPGASIGLARVSASGGEPEPVTVLDSGETSHVWPDALPNGKGVLFTIIGASGQTGAEIAVLDLASGTHRRLVPGVAARYAASRHLVFVTSDGTLMGVPFDPDALELAGEPTALSDGVFVGGRGVDLTLSTTGRLMYSASRSGPDASQELVWVNRDGTAEPIDPGWTGQLVSPSLSPDGSRLAVGIIQNNEQHVWVKQLDRGPLSQISFTGAPNYRPAWKPDGLEVAFISVRGDNRNVYSTGVDGNSPVELVRMGEPAINEVHFSPKGDWMVFRTGSGSTAQGRDLYGIRLGSDAPPVPLVVTEFQETSPAVSPDGRWLAYVSNRSGRYEVYVRPFPNTGDMRWPVSVDGGVEPVWAHSGQELFYKTGNNLVAARIIPDTSFVIGETQLLFSTLDYESPYEQHQHYDVAPDDRRFVMLRGRRNPGPAGLVVVENFFEELKAQVGRE